MRNFLLLFVFMLICLTTFSQTGSFQLGGYLSEGNFNAFNVNSSLNIRQDSGKYTWNAHPSFTLTYYDKIINREFYNSIAINIRFNNKWKILLFNEDENSFGRKINYRGSLGIGISHKFIYENKIMIDISEAILPELYMINNCDIKIIRLSTRVKFIYKKEKLTLSSITLIQPSIFNYVINEIPYNKSINIRSTNSLMFTITKKTSFGVGFDLINDGISSHINTKVKPLDTKLYFTVKYEI